MQTISKYSLLSLLLSLLFCSEYVFPQVPEGFEEFYESRIEDTRVEFNGETVEVMAHLSFESYRMDIDQVSKLESFLNGKIIPTYIEDLKKQLIEGVEYDSRCAQYDDCIIMTDTITLVFDYLEKRAKIFVHPDGLANTPNEVQYANNITQHNALINSIRLDSSLDSKYEDQTNLYGETVLGVKYGHINVEYQVSDDSNVSKLSYAHNIPDYELSIGYAKNELNGEESFGIFPGSFFSGSAISLGVSTSSNLYLHNGNETKYVNILSPVNGTARIFRGERLVDVIPVESGYNTLPYNELPNGIYEITIDIFDGSELVSTYSQNIYNLNVGGDDVRYSFFYSHIDPEYTDDEIGPSSSDVERTINLMTLRAVTPINESIDFGQLSRVSTDGEYSLAFGAGIRLPSLSAQTYAEIFSDQNMSFNVNMSYRNMYLDYSRLLESDYNQDSLTALFNDNYKHKLSATLYSNISQRLSSNSSAYALVSEEKGNSLTLNSELSYLFKNRVVVSIGASYQKYENQNGSYKYKNDEISGTLRVSIPLGDDIQIYSSSHIDELSTAVDSELRYHSEYLDTLAVKNRYRFSEESENSAYLDDLYSNDYLDLRTRVDVESDRVIGNVYAENTQIISEQGISFTKEASNSYIISEPNITGQPLNQEVLVGVTLIDDTYSNRSLSNTVGSKVVKGLEEYNNYRYRFEANPLGYATMDEVAQEGDHFALPGSLGVVTPNVARVDNALVRLKDISGLLVEDAECFNIGCLEAKEITPGVYNVKYVESTLMLDNFKNICAVDVQRIVAIKATCLPNVEPFDKFELVDVEYVMIGAITSNNLETRQEIVKTFGEFVKFVGLPNGVSVAYIKSDLVAANDRVSKFKLNHSATMSIKQAYENIAKPEATYAIN